jgi:hypothetical protein
MNAGLKCVVAATLIAGQAASLIVGQAAQESIQMSACDENATHDATYEYPDTDLLTHPQHTAVAEAVGSCMSISLITLASTAAGVAALLRAIAANSLLFSLAIGMLVVCLAKCGVPTTTSGDKLVDIELFTPNTIDDIGIKAGMKTDSSFLSKINMVNFASASIAPQGAYNETIEAEESVAATDNREGKAGTCPFARKELLEYQRATVYFREFLAKGHTHLGRGGPVCPFVPLALKKDSLYMGVVRGPRISRGGQAAGGKHCPGPRGATTAEQVRQVTRRFSERFFQLEPMAGKLAIYKAVFLIFPDVPIGQAHEVIDAVQAELKPEFVRKGLMLGEFHTQNNVAGLHNESFFPLRTATPCFAIRYIVPSDLVFLDISRYSEEVREQFLRAYLKRFGGPAGGPADAGDDGSGGVSAKDRPMIEKAINALDQIEAKRGGTG